MWWSSVNFCLNILVYLITPMSIAFSKINLPLTLVNSIQVLFLFLFGLGGFFGAFFSLVEGLKFSAAG